MKRKMVLYLAADLIVVWITLFIVLYLGFVSTVMFHFWGATGMRAYDYVNR